VNPYVALVRNNRNFRFLWLGQIVSQLGDWFSAIAVYALLLEFTGSATAVAWMLIVQFLPMAIVGPMAGVVVDRLDRRRVMIAADVLRGVLVLNLLLVDGPERVWLAYVVMAALVSTTAFFEPARTASIPNITSPSELLVANAISSATWSAMLAFGAAAGGLVAALAGHETAFVVNSGCLFLSAIFIARARFGARGQVEGRRGLAAITGLTSLVEGLGYIRGRSEVAALMLVKAGWGIAGGVLLLLAVFGERVFPIAGSAAASIGILHAARGVGAALGPILARAAIGQDPQTLRRMIGPAYFVVAFFHLALAASPGIGSAALSVVGAAMGGSVLWVFSTVLLQLEIPDRFRGRVFAVELAMVTLAISVSSYLTGYGLDRAEWSPRTLAALLGVLFCFPGIGWMLLEARRTSPRARQELRS
jgi:MFS family permease